MQIVPYHGIVLPILVITLALSHALPTFLESHPSSSPDFAPVTLDDREVTGIVPTVSNVSQSSFEAAPNLPAPNSGAPTLEEIISSGIAAFAPHVRSLKIWRVIATPTSRAASSRSADFQRVRLECLVELPDSRASRVIIADNKPAKPLEWLAPNVIDDLTKYTPWKPYDWMPRPPKLSTAFQLLEQAGLGGGAWEKIVQVSFFKDNLEPDTHPQYGNQIYFAFAKAIQVPPTPGELSWTFVGTTSGRIHQNLIYNPRAAPDTDYGEPHQSAFNGTWMIA